MRIVKAGNAYSFGVTEKCVMHGFAAILPTGGIRSGTVSGALVRSGRLCAAKIRRIRLENRQYINVPDE
jgi:hypothetical protein